MSAATTLAGLIEGTRKVVRVDIDHSDITLGVRLNKGGLIPAGSVIAQVTCLATETFAGTGTDVETSTVEFGLEDTDDVLATDIATLPAAGASVAGDQTGASTAMLVLTADRQLGLTVTAADPDNALTAGTLSVFIEFFAGV
jgi:hypothetical protein